LRLGIRVTIAHDGASAMRWIQDRRFDLVLLDCFMPDMDGFAVVQTVRALEKQSGSRHLPVIGISGESDIVHVQRCLDSGMDGVLGKPLPAGELEAMLVLWCDMPGQAMSAADVTGVDLPLLFRRTSQQDYAQLLQAADAGDMAAVGRLVHRMKGAALTMRAEDMVAVLQRIEAILCTVPVPDNLLQQSMQALLQQIDSL